MKQLLTLLLSFLSLTHSCSVGQKAWASWAGSYGLEQDWREATLVDYGNDDSKFWMMWKHDSGFCMDDAAYWRSGADVSQRAFCQRSPWNVLHYETRRPCAAAPPSPDSPSPVDDDSGLSASTVIGAMIGVFACVAFGCVCLMVAMTPKDGESAHDLNRADATYQKGSRPHFGMEQMNKTMFKWTFSKGNNNSDSRMAMLGESISGTFTKLILDRWKPRNKRPEQDTSVIFADPDVREEPNTQMSLWEIAKAERVPQTKNGRDARTWQKYGAYRSKVGDSYRAQGGRKTLDNI